MFENADAPDSGRPAVMPVISPNNVFAPEAFARFIDSEVDLMIKGLERIGIAVKVSELAALRHRIELMTLVALDPAGRC
ncbi:hypothetical protein [Bradyrhizobium sp. dw_78]|uniref:hypothetical protein n=1 Tax=Bradyrhizobium sp. dw_78 TaxID=2719793 RepID=UPI001BD60FCB|nr:hypothetical protein [Bradyrhizobium sp. dw_78]